MVITPTLETLRFMGARIAEIRQLATDGGAYTHSIGTSLAENLIARVRAQQLAELVPVLHESGQTLLALEVALAVPIPSLRCVALQYLGRLGYGHRSVLREAVETIKEIANEREQAQALIQLASDLPSDIVPEAVTLARQLTWGYGRVCALNTLAQQCIDPNERHELMTEAFEGVLQIDDPQEAADAIVELMPEMNWQDVSRAIQELLVLIGRIPSETTQVALLGAIVDQLDTWINTNSVPIHILTSHLSAVHNIAQKCLPSSTYYQQLFDMKVPSPRTQNTIEMAVPESLLRQAVAEMKATIKKVSWTEAIVDLLPLVSTGQSNEQAMPLSLDFSPVPEPTDPIHTFVNCLPAGMMPDMLSLGSHLPCAEDQAELLSIITPRLSEGMLDESFAMICRLPEKLQCQVFRKIASTLPLPYVRRAILHLESLPPSPDQVEAVSVLVHLTVEV